MKCCNVECETPFCPLCGNSVRAKNPLEELLAHVSRQRNTTASDVHCARQNCAGDPGQESYWSKRIARLEEIADKWKRWAVALAELMAQAEGKS